MSCIWMRIKKYFYVSGFVLSLALKQRLKATRKWPKSCDKTRQLHNKGVQLWDTNIGLGHQYGNRDVMWKGYIPTFESTWNPMVWPFKWKLLNSNSTWYYLFFSILLNEIWQFCRTLTWLPLAVRRSNHDISLYILHTVLHIFSPELVRLVNSFWKHSGPSYLIISFTFITCKLGLKEWYNKIWCWSLLR